MSDTIIIEEADAADADVVEALSRLLPQLSSSARAPTAREVEAIVHSGCTTLLVARDSAQGGRIVGSLTLAVFRIPTGMRAWIEDVVVDSAARGHGVGEALSREALLRAASQGAGTVELTSRLSREAANRLYRRLGFEQRETNVYRYRLPRTT
jgi:ribosomal protein S18 acetylase RimI-like enzyme